MAHQNNFSPISTGMMYADAYQTKPKFFTANQNPAQKQVIVQAKSTNRNQKNYS